MATKILRPVAIGTVDDWALGAGASKFAAVDPGDPVSHDNDTSYISEAQNLNQEQRFTIDPLFSEQMAFISELRVHARVRDEGTARISNRLRVYLNSIQVQGATFSTAGTSWTAAGNNVSFALARPGGGDWTEDDLRDATFEFSIFTPSQGGPVIRCTSLWVEVDYVPAIQRVQQHRQHASRRLMRRSREEPVYTLTVPLHFLSLEVMDLINVSHDALPLSASRLSGISDHGLMDQWRRGIFRLVGMDEDVQRREVRLTFKDHESYMSTFFSSEMLLAGGNHDYDDLMRFYPGGTLTVDRNTRVFLEQPSALVEEVAQDPTGSFFFGTDIFQEPMNHLGFLAEEATHNPILNSIAKNGETSWTSVANSGTLDLSTLRLAFEKKYTSNSWRFLRANNSADTYREQAFSVLAADAFRRIYVTHSEQSTTAIISWALQRSSDSNWWNDTSGAWQVAKKWNNLTNRYSSAAGRAVIGRDVSKPIDISSNQTWTLQVGLEGASLPAGGGEGNVYAVSALKGKLRFSEVPTDAAAVTTQATSVTIKKTSGSQLVAAARGTLTLEMEAIQAGGDLVDGDKLTLLTWTYDAAEDDYDALIYEKPAGVNPRFSFERYRASGGAPVFNARATFTVTTVPGTVYKIACIWTASSGGDLGLPNNSMRILVNRVRGVDGTASGTHDAGEVETALYKGWSPYAGYRRAMNYIRLIRFSPRPITDEEAP